MLADIRLAYRSLRSAPGFAVVAVLVLAIGIGATTAVYSVLDAVLLRPLPYADPGELVWFYETNPERGWDRAEVAPANFLDWRESMTAVSDITAVQDWLEDMTLLTSGEPRMVMTLAVYGNFFDVLGVPPLLGRGFREEETWAGRDAVAVLSHGFWQDQYGGDPGVVGRRIVLDGEAREVVGVMPPSFRTPDVVWSSPSSLAGPVDVWIPFGTEPADVGATFFRRAHVVQAIGRLAEGASLDRARSELGAVAARLEAAYPETNEGMGAGIEPLRASVVDHARVSLYLVMAAVGLMLLIACANLANLMLIRALQRRRELAVRSALGASRLRLVRYGLGESLVLALAGGAAGLLVALWGTDLLVRLAPTNMPRLADVGLNGRVLAFSLAATLATGFAFGLLPAIRTAGLDLDRVLRSGGAGSAGASRGRSRGALVALEVALALVLTAAAGLLVRTVGALRAVDAGFEAEGRLAIEVQLPSARYPGFEERAGFQRRLLDRAREIPGVSGAALARRLPLEGGWTSRFSIAGRAPEQAVGDITHREVSPGFFEVLGTPVAEGRAFEPGDDGDAPPVVVVNRAFADRYLPGGAVGRRMSFDERPGDGSIWYDIIGVAGNQRQRGLRTEALPEVFGSSFQAPGTGVTLILHTQGDPAALTAAVRGVLRELDPTIPLGRVTTLDAVVDGAMAGELYLLGLLASFAGAALLLALLGVYGVTGQTLRERTTELGIRAALGADPGRLLRAILAGTMGPVAVGAALGLLAAVPAARLLDSLVFGVRAVDPVTLGAAAALVMGAALLAALGPARHARRMQPMRILRRAS